MDVRYACARAQRAIPVGHGEQKTACPYHRNLALNGLALVNVLSSCSGSSILTFYLDFLNHVECLFFFSLSGLVPTARDRIVILVILVLQLDKPSFKLEFHRNEPFNYSNAPPDLTALFKGNREILTVGGVMIAGGG